AAQGYPTAGGARRAAAHHEQLRVDVQGHLARLGGRPAGTAQGSERCTGALRQPDAADRRRARLPRLPLADGAPRRLCREAQQSRDDAIADARKTRGPDVNQHQAAADAFPVEKIRAMFPALQKAGDFIFLDNAAGAQIPQSVLDAVTDHLVSHNEQRGGRDGRSVTVDRVIDEERVTVATRINAYVPAV